MRFTMSLIIFLCLNVSLAFSQPTPKDIDHILSQRKAVDQLARSGKFRESIELAEKIVPIAKSTLGEKHEEHILTILQLTSLYNTVQRPEKAEPIIANLLVLIKKHYPERDPLIKKISKYLEDTRKKIIFLINLEVLSSLHKKKYKRGIKLALKNIKLAEKNWVKSMKVLLPLSTTSPICMKAITACLKQNLQQEELWQYMKKITRKNIRQYNLPENT